MLGDEGRCQSFLAQLCAAGTRIAAASEFQLMEEVVQ
jgi:hypothetical protein